MVRNYVNSYIVELIDDITENKNDEKLNSNYDKFANNLLNDLFNEIKPKHENQVVPSEDNIKAEQCDEINEDICPLIGRRHSTDISTNNYRIDSRLYRRRPIIDEDCPNENEHITRRHSFNNSSEFNSSIRNRISLSEQNPSELRLDEFNNKNETIQNNNNKNINIKNKIIFYKNFKKPKINFSVTNKLEEVHQSVESSLSFDTSTTGSNNKNLDNNSKLICSDTVSILNSRTASSSSIDNTLKVPFKQYTKVTLKSILNKNSIAGSNSSSCLSQSTNQSTVNNNQSNETISNKMNESKFINDLLDGVWSDSFNQIKMNISA